MKISYHNTVFIKEWPCQQRLLIKNKLSISLIRKLKSIRHRVSGMWGEH